MDGQIALEIDLQQHGELRAQPRPLDDRPHFVGALELCMERDEPTWVVANGPLAATAVPGASELTLASRGAGGAELELCSIADAGLAFDGLGRSPLILRGRCASPSVLLLMRRGAGDDAIEQRLEAIDPETCWADGGAAGVAKRVGELCGDVRSGVLLACGPAAREGQLGAVVCSPIRDGVVKGPTALSPRGAFGSRLLQQHGVLALVVASDRPLEQLLSRSATDGPFLGLFEAGMSAAELEHALDISLDADLVRGGRLLAELRARGRDGGLWLNGRSAELERGDREHFALATRQGLIDPLLGGMGGPRSANGLGSPLVASGVCLDAELGIALGPQLGVLTRDDLVALAARCYALGLEPQTSGAIVAWLLDGIDVGEIAPGDVGLPAAPPKWPTRGDARAAALLSASPEIARAAGTLLDTLGGVAAGGAGGADDDGDAAWVTAARRGPLALAETLGVGAQRLIWRRRRGGMGYPPEAWWSAAALAPLPPVPGWRYAARETASPRVYGTRAARHTSAALMLADLGVSPAQASWARVRFGDLINRCYGVQVDWRVRYRNVLERWTRELSPSYWASERVVAVLHRGLWAAEHDGLSAGEADGWLARFERDRVGAARAFWSELCAGIADAFM